MADQNDVAMIQNALGPTLSRGLEPFAKRVDEEHQRNRPLSSYEKWLGKVLSGELSPDQAAAHAKLEMQGIQTAPSVPQQAPGGLAPTSSVQQPLSKPIMPQAPTGLGAATPGEPEAYPAMQSQQGGLGQRIDPTSIARIDPGMGSQAPQTAGDFGALMGAAPFLRAAKTGANALTFEQRQILALQAQAAAQQRTDTTTGSRESEGAKGRDAKKAHDETYGTLQRELTTQKMNTAIEIARMKMQNSKNSAYAKNAFKPVEILQKQVAATDAAIGKLAMSIGALTPGSPEATHVQKMIQEANSERSLLMAKLESALNVVTSMQDESGSESESSPAYQPPNFVQSGITAQPGLTPVDVPTRNGGTTQVMAPNVPTPDPQKGPPPGTDLGDVYGRKLKAEKPVMTPSAAELNRIFGK